MTDTKQTRSKSTKNAGDTQLNFCCGDSEKMSRMMRQFCTGQDERFDCESMMQMMNKMCCAAPGKSGGQ